MIVDCHTHIKCVGFETVDTSEHIEAASMVDRCIVLPSADGPAEQLNEQLSEYVGRYSQKMVGFAFLDPLNNGVSVRNLKAATEKLGLKGIVLYCAACGFHPAHTRAFQLYESAQEIGLPIFFHNSPVGPGGILEYAQPLLLDEVARTFPSLKIVIGNMGLPFVEQTFCLLAKHQNVFGDLSVKPGKIWEVYNLVLAAHEQGVTDKLLFGSAFPAARPQQCMETLLGFNKLLTEAHLPMVPRANMQGIIERETLKLLGIEK
ncbi:MAG: amidohydrolase family protein [Sedimentisphaerales bacterium]